MCGHRYFHLDLSVVASDKGGQAGLNLDWNGINIAPFCWACNRVQRVILNLYCMGFRLRDEGSNLDSVAFGKLDRYERGHLRKQNTEILDISRVMLYVCSKSSFAGGLRLRVGRYE